MIWSTGTKYLGPLCRQQRKKNALKTSEEQFHMPTWITDQYCKGPVCRSAQEALCTMRGSSFLMEIVCLSEVIAKSCHSTTMVKSIFILPVPAQEVAVIVFHVPRVLFVLFFPQQHTAIKLQLLKLCREESCGNARGLYGADGLTGTYNNSRVRTVTKYISSDLGWLFLFVCIITLLHASELKNVMFNV